MHSKIFSPGHVDVIGNERVDSLAGDAAIDKNLTHQDPEEGMINSSQDIKARKMCGFTTFSLALLETGTNCPKKMRHLRTPSIGVSCGPPAKSTALIETVILPT